MRSAELSEAWSALHCTGRRRLQTEMYDCPFDVRAAATMSDSPLETSSCVWKTLRFHACRMLQRRLTSIVRISPQSGTQRV